MASRDKTCKQCGDDFHDDSRTNTRKYCSESCKEQYKIASGKKKSRDKTCKYCDDDFRDDSRSNNRKFCSDECGRRFKQEKHSDGDVNFLGKDTCDRCGSVYNEKNAGQKYCSDDCREADKVEERYRHVPDDLSRTVVCKECGEEFNGCIPHGSESKGDHFQNEHDMTSTEYREKHGSGTVYSEASKWKLKNPSP